MNNIQVSISKKTLFIIAAGLITLFGFYYIRDVVVLLIITFILQAGFRPVVDFLESKYKLPRFLSTILIVLLVGISIIFFVYLTADLFIQQINNLIQNIPSLLQRSIDTINSIIPGEQVIIDQESIDSLLQSLQSQVQNFNARSIIQLISDSFGGISSIGNVGIRILGSTINLVFTSVVVLFASCYMIVRKTRIYEGIIPYISDQHQARSRRTLDTIQSTVGNWFVGQIALMLIIGFATFIIVMIPAVIGIEGYELHKFVLIIALIAAITEALPNIGPVIAMAIIIFIALGTGATAGIILYLIISLTLLQQLEGIFIVPAVMKRVIDIDPVISIFGIVIGFNVLGVVGAIIALPLIATLKVVIKELRFGSNENEPAKSESIEVELEIEEEQEIKREQKLKSKAKKTKKK